MSVDKCDQCAAQQDKDHQQSRLHLQVGDQQDAEGEHGDDKLQYGVGQMADRHEQGILEYSGDGVVKFCQHRIDIHVHHGQQEGRAPWEDTAGPWQ